MAVSSSTPITITRPPRPPAVIGRHLAAQYRLIGLAGRADRIDEIHDRCAAWRADTATSAADLRRLKEALVLDIVADRRLWTEAAVELQRARDDAAAMPVGAELLDGARRTAQGILADEFWRAGDELIHELDAVVQAAVQRLIDSALLIGDVDTDAKAARANPAMRAAWAAVLIDTEVVENAWDLASALRLDEVVPTVREAGPSDWQYRDTLRLPGSRRPDGQHPALALLDDIAAGAAPACVTADELLDALAADQLARTTR